MPLACIHMLFNGLASINIPYFHEINLIVSFKLVASQPSWQHHLVILLLWYFLSTFKFPLYLLSFWYLHLVRHLDLVVYSSWAELILIVIPIWSTQSKQKQGNFAPDSDFPQTEHMRGRRPRTELHKNLKKQNKMTQYMTKGICNSFMTVSLLWNNTLAGWQRHPVFSSFGGNQCSSPDHKWRLCPNLFNCSCTQFLLLQILFLCVTVEVIWCQW